MLLNKVKYGFLVFSCLVLVGCSDPEPTAEPKKEKHEISEDNPFKPMVDAYKKAEDVNELAKKKSQELEDLLK